MYIYFPFLGLQFGENSQITSLLFSLFHFIQWFAELERKRAKNKIFTERRIECTLYLVCLLSIFYTHTQNLKSNIECILISGSENTQNSPLNPQVCHSLSLPSLGQSNVEIEKRKKRKGSNIFFDNCVVTTVAVQVTEDRIEDTQTGLKWKEYGTNGTRKTGSKRRERRERVDRKICSRSSFLLLLPPL